MNNLEVHDIVLTYIDNSQEYYIVGRINYIDMQIGSTTADAYGILYHSKDTSLKQLHVSTKNVKPINPKHPSRKAYLPVPTIDEVEEHYYENKND